MDSSIIIVALVVVFALGLIVGTGSRSTMTRGEDPVLQIARLLRAMREVEAPSATRRKRK